MFTDKELRKNYNIMCHTMVKKAWWSMLKCTLTTLFTEKVTFGQPE